MVWWWWSWTWKYEIQGDIAGTDCLNVKGLEVEVLADLIHSGALQHLDYIYVDFHSWMDKDHKKFRYSIPFISGLFINLSMGDN